MNPSTPPGTPAAVTRTELRRQMLVARQAWIQGPLAQAAQSGLEKNVLDVLRRLEPECLGLYWPVQGEFNPRPVALMVQTEWACQLALPWAQREPRQMQYRPWDGTALTTTDECGIPSPSGPACRPDVVLVPCVGFTQDGYRLGYGGGYFDRYLAAHPDVTAIGVSWSIGELGAEVLQPEAHDMPLLCVLTE
ncbi:MAG: 5-formyltetrahydrofolate cyclo-ligase [Rubrivivax sp.]|nr:MAG: 5-formyltetrahydrofolate cyclo-ligase [Rubrivivax sp.]